MERSSFDVVAELVARDVDMTLLRRALARTPTERIQWLEEMQEFSAQARKSARDERAKAEPRAR